MHSYCCDSWNKHSTFPRRHSCSFRKEEEGGVLSAASLGGVPGEPRRAGGPLNHMQHGITGPSGGRRQDDLSGTMLDPLSGQVSEMCTI